MYSTWNLETYLNLSDISIALAFDSDSLHRATHQLQGAAVDTDCPEAAKIILIMSSHFLKGNFIET